MNPMATLTIRNVDPALKERLRLRAARNGRSMAAELRHILKATVGAERKTEVNLAEAIRRRRIGTASTGAYWVARTTFAKVPVMYMNARASSLGRRGIDGMVGSG
jgi:plasmid stability protein